MALAFAALGVIAVGLWVSWDYTRRTRLVNGPMIQQVTETGFTVVWRVHPTDSTMGAVEVVGGDGTPVGRFPAQLEGDQWIAGVEGLQPDSEYLYRIQAAPTSGEPRVFAEHRARTAPTRGRAFRFLAFGDSGGGSRAQYRLAAAMPGWSPDLIIHTGDLVYPFGAPDEYPGGFYRPYAELISHVPFYPCLGNHDVRTANGQPLLDAFVLPRNGPAADTPEWQYWFDFGDARFVALDSNLHEPEIRATTVPWLESVLATAGARWKIVFVHEAIYTNGTKYPKAAKLISTVVPLFDRYRVELVLYGHIHLYERTWPIYNSRLAEDGTVYVTTGAGGGNLIKQLPRRPEWLAAANDRQHGFTVVDVGQDELSLRQIGADGSVLDQARIRRRGISTTAPASRPLASAGPRLQHASEDLNCLPPRQVRVGSF